LSRATCDEQVVHMPLYACCAAVDAGISHGQQWNIRR